SAKKSACRFICSPYETSGFQTVHQRDFIETRSSFWQKRNFFTALVNCATNSARTSPTASCARYRSHTPHRRRDDAERRNGDREKDHKTNRLPAVRRQEPSRRE